MGLNVREKTNPNVSGNAVTILMKRESDGLALKQGVRIQFREHLSENGIEHNRQVFRFDFSDV